MARDCDYCDFLHLGRLHYQTLVDAHPITRNSTHRQKQSRRVDFVVTLAPVPPTEHILFSHHAKRTSIMTTAFIPAAGSGAFTTHRSSSITNISSGRRAAVATTTPCMTANWPDDTSAPYTKYLSQIPMDRLNKAPFISMIDVPDTDYNSMSMSLNTIAPDESAAASLLAGIYVDEEEAPSSDIWGKYYDPETVNEAPIITMVGDKDLPYERQYVCVLQSQVKTSITDAWSILDPPPPTELMYGAKYKNRFNKAPYIQVFEPTADSEGSVVVENVTVALNIFNASKIQRKVWS